MKHSVKYLYHLLIACLLVAQGCQVQQRRYTGGWNIQWPSPNAISIVFLYLLIDRFEFFYDISLLIFCLLLGIINIQSLI